MGVELSILVATVPSQRPGLLSRLLAALEPQLDDPAVEVIIHESEAKPMGTKFDELYKAAHGRLSVQIDDDDLVDAEFVREILTVSPGHDFVGYKVDHTVNGQLPTLTVFEINPLRTRTLRRFMMDDLVRPMSPKCPVETAHARQFPFGNYQGSDYDWTLHLIMNGYPFNPVFIDKRLYWYDCWPMASLGVKPSEWQSQRQVPILSYDRDRFTWIQ